MTLQPPASIADLPNRVRLFPLGGSILLPRAVMPLNIFEPRYLAMVRDAMADDHMIAMIQPRAEGEPRPPLYEVGCIGRITQYSETGDGRFLIALTGLARFQLRRELSVTTPYRQAEVEYEAHAADWSPAEPLAATARANLEDVLKSYLEAQGLSADWDAVRSADDESLVNTLSAVCPFVPSERQALLEAQGLPERADTLATLMSFALGASDGRTLQ
ncbi:LON peptidase substrate-binding domain-containing protein [Sandaracinobacteroides hominis]|uniref:LON peptidase substrate-binding domain-containing protein n=1 Tax=Sandaracinobacteroides hominis TaxID=2780086 RepID=UPI0018F7B6E3|nr:LON peptidase substrate-binding domain-containing protein [Sandaracinobacteroides hominis]